MVKSLVLAGLIGLGGSLPAGELMELKDNTFYVLSSSFANYTDAYPDNLIDGKSDTCWRPMPNEKSHYLEFFWRAPVKISQIELTLKKTDPKGIIKVFVPQKENWKLITETSETKIKIPVTASRSVHLELENFSPGLEVGEVKFLGPQQYILGSTDSYWHGCYIWYPEVDNLYIPNEPRFFRQSFDLKDADEVIEALIQSRSNDFFAIYLNGQKVSTGSTLIVPVQVKKYLKPGRNVISAEAMLGSNPSVWGHGEFITELAIATANDIKYIATSKEWKSTNKRIEGWEQPDFDDSKWVAAAELSAPPGGPWGRIGYTKLANNAKFMVSDSRFELENGNLKISFGVKIKQPVSDDYVFVVNIGEESTQRNYGRFMLPEYVIEASPPTGKWTVDKLENIDTTLELPEFIPAGKQPVKIFAKRIKDGSEVLISSSQVELKKAPEVKSLTQGVGKLVKINGQWAMELNGEPKPLFLWRSMPQNSLDRFYNRSQTGLNVHQILMYPVCIKPDKNLWQNDFTFLDQQIRALLNIDPAALIFVGPDLRPNLDWRKKYPEDCLLTAQGKRGPVSFASQRYWDDTKEYMQKLIAHVQAQPYSHNVIGYMPMTCGIMDSGLGGVEDNVWQADRSKLTMGDFNPQAIKAYQAWLRNKYKTLEKLRQAWHNSTITFETASPVMAELSASGDGNSLFRNPETQQPAIDYYEFLPALLGDFNRRLCKLVKDETQNRALVMIHYGYNITHLRALNAIGARNQNGNWDFAEVMRDKNVDIFLGAPDYAYRLAGNSYNIYFPIASMRLNNKAYIADGDYRTWISGPKLFGRHRSFQETDACIKRDMGTWLAANSGTWLADMSESTSGRSGVGWFEHPQARQLIKEINRQFQTAISKNTKSTAQIAVFISLETPRFEDLYYTPAIYDSLVVNLIWQELNRLGAPYDIYLMSDLEDHSLPQDYRLAIFVNSFAVNAKQRAGLDKLKADKRTLLWFYAPGYVEMGINRSVRNINKLIGIKVKAKVKSELMTLKIDNLDNPLTKGLTGITFGVKEFANKQVANLHPAVISPVFQVDDSSATALGHYPDGTVAFAVKDFAAWRSIYSAVPAMNLQLLRKIAETSGVHIYCKDNIVFQANSHYIMLHSGYGKEQKIKISLPEKKTVKDIFADKLIANEVNDFEINLPECSTIILSLE